MAGTAKSSAEGFFAWEAEDSFADTADDTYTTRHQVRGEIDFSGLQRPLIDRGGTFQRLNEGENPIAGAFGMGSITVTLDAAGHGGTTAGDLTETNLYKLLKHVFGDGDSTQYGGQDDGSGDADTLEPDGGSEAFTVGGLLRVGALGDTRAEGQACAVSAATGTPVNTAELLTALPGAPADDDVIYAMLNVYPSTASNIIYTADGSANNNTIRIVAASQNYQYVLRGAVCTAAALRGLSPASGEVPIWELTFTGVQWEPVSQTYPSATATDDKDPAVAAAGTCFLQAAGTTTSALVVPRDFEMNIGMGVVPVYGSGGENTGQNITGWRRVPAPSSISMSVEAEAATATPTYHVLATNTTARHILYTHAPIDGKALAIYAPRAYLQSAIPTQNAVDGLNYVTLDFNLLTNTTTTTELTLSNWRLGMG